MVEVELHSVEAAVGSTSFSRGRQYARNNRVLSVVHDAAAGELSGKVIGRGGLYDVLAVFADDDVPLELIEGECSCPVGWNCKHVAALVIAASESGRLRAAPVEPAWERSLSELVDEPAAQTAGSPLAIEIKLDERVVAGSRTVRLLARLMRPGARGGWINGSLAWDGLESWNRSVSQLRRDHVALAKELHALRRTTASYIFSTSSDRALDLGAYESRRLWSVLEDAERAGVALIHGDAALGSIPAPVTGELTLDVVTAEDGGIRGSAALEAGDEALTPVLFIGDHGLVCVAGEPDLAPGQRPLRLVRLTRPASPALRRMVLEGTSFEIPAGERERFTHELSPALRHAARVVSSDGSFELPRVSAPELVLRVAYGATDHAADVEWGWRYRVGERVEEVSLDALPGTPRFRDLGAEQTRLGSLQLEQTGLERFGLVDDHGRPTSAPVRLTGMNTARLATECLPALEQRTELALAVDGTPPDFRDVGSSLRVELSTAQPQGERDWFDLGVTITVEGREVPFAPVFTALAAGEARVLLPDGAHFSLQGSHLQTLRALIEEARELSDTPTGALRLSRYQTGLWLELVALGVVTKQAEAWERQVAAITELEALPAHPLPAALQAELRPYQREGFSWLATLWELGLGGILADDMGLGKTVQTLALIGHVRERDPDSGPFLVVAPTSVVPNWAAETARFMPGLTVATVTDTMSKSGRDIAHVAEADIVVTSYTLLRLEAEHYGAVAWAGLILDEAQHVKNHQAKTYRCTRELAAPFKLAITGTPMENNLMELWSLLSITAPGLFPDPKRFSERYARPIERHGDREQLARLRARIKPLVKRRTKELVASDLPARQEQTLAVELHPRHQRLYDKRLQRERQKVLGLIEDLDRHRFTILRSLTLLRQLSLHPTLVEEDAGKVPCMKLDVLADHLGEVALGGHRALVFSQFTGFLALVRERLDREGIDYCYLDGRTRNRQRVIDRFKSGTDPVFLISLKAGGAGLNLTEADYCFLLDPWWNPATEQQAIDRIHRIGQQRPVNVYRIVARGTIEEKVVELARRKAELFKGVLDDGDLFSGSLSAADIRGLLGDAR